MQTVRKLPGLGREGVILWFAHLACVLGAAQFAVPLRWRLSSRDRPAAPKGVLFGRANRALANYVENFTVFAALDLALIATNQVSTPRQSRGL